MSRSRKACKGILLLSAGSKVAIAEIAKKAALPRGLALHASDCNQNVPTRHFCDAFSTFDIQDRNTWLDSIIGYCEKHSIGLVIPTRHSDLPFLAAAHERFAAIGANLSLSSKQAISLCTQKLDTYEFLKNAKAPVPETTTKANLSESCLSNVFPVFAKPPSGSSGEGAIVVRDAKALDSIPENWILQTLAKGQEYTVNIYIDRNGIPLCAIPHSRIIVESGEVAQARTERLPNLIEECLRIAELLPRAQGIINIQAFYDHETGSFEIIEINPRIGGGFPLAHQAKGSYIDWLCEEWLDGKALAPFHKWTENLLMMRYRDAIFQVR